MLIDGLRTGASSKGWIPVIDPATEEPIAEVPRGMPDDVDAAVRAADAAFTAWSRTAPAERGAVLYRAAARVRARAEDLALLLTSEQGKPLDEARKEIGEVVRTFGYYAGAATTVLGEIAPTDATSTKSLVFKYPVGVVAAIGPWNYPVSLLAWKIAPALAAGCTLVVKPATETPLAAQAMVEEVLAAGLPRGALNLITGYGRDIGDALIEHPLVRKISFTGSTEVGRRIMAKAAGTIKRVSLELGGQCPMIVWHDADFDRAVRDGVRRAFRNMGQICNSVNRIYVHQAIAEPYIEAFVRQTKALRIGDGRSPDVDLGPMATREGLTKTMEHIDDAVANGARLLCGGRRPAGVPGGRGYFLEPAVLVDVDHRMKVMREETFGPVAPIMVVSDLDDTVRLANDSAYGLVAYAYTRDLRTAMAFVDGLEAGSVGINTVSVASVYAPYGGWKQSGIGRELGRSGLEAYFELKHAVVDVS
jgi:acyl-CoA reductase-like NAD-dependent aldehyde dehydrogenase